MSAARCAAAHPDDPTPCEGPHDAVRILDQHGAETLACVRHGARLYASLDRPRVYPGSVNGGALEVYNRAQQLQPFPWTAERSPLTGRTLPPAYGPTTLSNADEPRPPRAIVHVAVAMSRDELWSVLAAEHAEVDPDRDPAALTVPEVRRLVEEWLAASSFIDLIDLTTQVQEGAATWPAEQRAVMDSLAAAVDRAYPPEVDR